MKKYLSILLVFLLIVSLSACKKPKENLNSSEAEITVNNTDDVIVETDDTVDPENTENSEEGVEIDIQNITPKNGVAIGVDVSKWQGKIDWNSVKKSGIEFAIIRIGYRAENGKIYKDANADYNIQQAQKAGMLVGVYFFSTAVNENEAREEAEFVVNAVKGYKISYPVVYDYEGFTNSESRTYSLSTELRTNNALTFLSHVEKIGYTGMFYGAKNQIENNAYWDMAVIENRFKVWLAHYSNPTYPDIENPDYSGKYDMWQYTNKGTVPGVEGNCDINVSYFSADEANPLDSSVTPDDAPVPKTQEELIYKDVNDSVTAKEEVNLREGAGTKFNIVGKLKSGEFLTRTAIGTNGWSKLLLDGKTVYAITSYLSNEVVEIKKQDIVNDCLFTPHSDKVTAKSEVNLRSLPTTDSEVLGKLVSGTFVERTAISDKGWSRLNFNGQTVYAVTSYLTLNAPEIDFSSQPDAGDTSFTEFDTIFKSITPTNVTAKEEINLRSKPTTDSEIIYLLKNGEYVTKVAVSDSGWSKLEYNGQAVYAVDSFLMNY